MSDWPVKIIVDAITGIEQRIPLTQEEIDAMKLTPEQEAELAAKEKQNTLEDIQKQIEALQMKIQELSS